MQLLNNNVAFYSCVMHEIEAHSSTSILSVFDEFFNYIQLYWTRTYNSVLSLAVSWQSKLPPASIKRCFTWFICICFASFNWIHHKNYNLRKKINSLTSTSNCFVLFTSTCSKYYFTRETVKQIIIILDAYPR